MNEREKAPTEVGARPEHWPPIELENHYDAVMDRWFLPAALAFVALCFIGYLVR